MLCVLRSDVKVVVCSCYSWDVYVDCSAVSNCFFVSDFVWRVVLRARVYCLEVPFDSRRHSNLDDLA